MHNMMQCTMQNTAKSRCNEVDQVGCIIINATEVKRARLAVGRSACNPRIKIIALVSHTISSLFFVNFSSLLCFDTFNALFQLAPVEQISAPQMTASLH